MRKSELEELSDGPVRPGDRGFPWKRAAKELREEFFRTSFGRAMRFTFWIGAALSAVLIFYGMPIIGSLVAGALTSVAMAFSMVMRIHILAREALLVLRMFR